MKAITVGLIVILAAGVFPTDADGDEFELTPSLAVRGEYDDNIFYSSSDEEDDSILTIKAGLELIERTERLDVKLSGEVAPFFYEDNSDLNGVDQDYRGRIGYWITPVFAGRADAFFNIDNRPNRDIEATGLVQNVDQRDRYYFGAGLTYLLSEKAALDLAYAFSQDDWDSDVGDLEDVTRNVGNIGFIYNLGRWLEATTGRFNIGYADYDYETSEIKTFSGTVGVHHMLSEIFSLQVDVGARYVDSVFDVVEFVFVPPATVRPVIVKESNSGWGGIGQALLEYHGEKTYSNFYASRDLSAASGRLGPTKLTLFNFSFYHRFLKKMRWGLTAGFYRNKADRGDFSFQEIDQDTFGIRPSIRWEFFDNFTLEGAYSYTYLNDRFFDTTTTRNAVYLQLAYGLPLFEFLDLSGFERRQDFSGAVPLPEPVMQ
jgi:hypothetical protein